MGERKWQPGDVAMADNERVFMDLSSEWRWAETRRVCLDQPPCGLRPLVVIDPEDREQVTRLLARFVEAVDASFTPAHPQGWSLPSMQAALREFANPTPKPPEDVAARVLDRRDNIWRLLADGDWVCVDGPDLGEYLDWDHLSTERGPLKEQP